MIEIIIFYLVAALMRFDAGAIAVPPESVEVAAEDTGKGKGEPGVTATPEAVAEAAAAQAEAEAAAAAEMVPDAPPVREPETQIATGRFTTAVEVKPILTATKPQWVAVREYEGQDLLYFTNLLAWRCGLWEVRYGLNGAPPETVLPIEPCHDDTAQPNAMVDAVGFPIWIEAPLGSIESIDIEIDYDDGTMDAAIFARRSVLMPG